MSGLNGWKPLYDAHAIEQVSAKIRFSQPVTDIPWRAIRGIAKAVAERLSLQTEQPLQAVGLRMSNSGPSPAPVKVVGYEFLRFETPEFFAERLSVERNALSFETFRYTRWAAMRARLDDAFKTILEPYLAAVPVRGVQLEYVDRFVATGGVDGADCGEIVSTSSPYCAPGSMAAREPWHCHTGWFENSDPATRRLVNVDIDVADIQTMPEGSVRRSVRIRTHAFDQFNVPDVDTIPDDRIGHQFMMERFDAQHIFLKELLAKVLSAEAATAISLRGGQ